jgi:hypothetical protein
MRREMALDPGGLPDADLAHHLAGEIGAGEDANHAGHLGRGGGVDALDLAVGDGAVQDGDVCRTRQVDVRGEFRFAAKHFRIFAAPETGAQSFVCHDDARPRDYLDSARLWTARTAFW